MRSLIAFTLLSFSLTFTTFSAFAQDATAPAGEALSLKQNMKAADKLFKAITATAGDAAHNAENAENALMMAGYFQQTLAQFPDAIKDMPAAQQEAALADYKNRIGQVVTLAGQLHDAFVANDNAAAVSLCQKLKDLKHAGHDKYNP
jgi:uncharacterized Zn finger protein